jgi:hypothetical protein
MIHRRGLLSGTTGVLVSLFTASCAGAPAGPVQPVAAAIVFTASGQLEGTVGQPFSYSFCKPDLIGNAALCGTLAADATNPSGGQPPYHFQLGSGVGFPPSGITLSLNGVLSGTPSIAGTSTFAVCATDLAGQSVCNTVTMTVVGTVTVNRISWSCSISATPLPGWKNCTGTVTLTISKIIPSGYVSAYFDYGSTGSFFHGELAVTSGGPAQTVTVNLIDEYVSACETSYLSTVTVYDGHQSALRPPLLAVAPVQLTSTCQ